MMNEENDFSQNPERQLGRELTDFEHELLHRIDQLEKRVARLPCDHVGFPHDVEYDLDEDDFEIEVTICRNCGDRIG